ACLKTADDLLARRPQFIERRTLGLAGLHDVGDACNRPVRQVRGAIDANFGGALLRTAGNRHAPAAGVGARSEKADLRSGRNGRAGTAVGVGAVDAVIKVVVGIGPKVIIGIRPEHIVEKVVIDVRPEHRSDPADGETAPPPGPGRTKEPAVESRKPKARLQGRVADDAIAEYSTGSGYARARKVIGREARRCDTLPRRRKRPPGEIPSSERSNSATADTRAADRTADKAQPPTAASEAPWAASHVPTEATASAATTAWTGVRCVDDRGNGEEQDRRGGNTSDQASLGGNGRFECRCARRRRQRLHAEMAHGPPPKLNDWCRSVSLSVHCDKRKEKDRLVVGEGRCRGVHDLGFRARERVNEAASLSRQSPR